jgi:general stress protein 26
MTEKELQLNDIKKYFFNNPLVYFATSDKNQPRVRPMALINHNEELWIVSRSYEDKVKQIKKNSKFELTFMVDDEFKGMIRAAGNAQVIEDLEIKKELVESISWFSNYFKSHEDPNYGLIKLEILEVRTLSSGTRCKFEWC